MRKQPQRILCLFNALLVGLPVWCCLPAWSVTDQDRYFYRRVLGHDGTDEEVLLFAAVIDEIEGNYAVLHRYRELQNLYAKHKPKSLAREAWVYSMLAYNELLHGSKKKAAECCDTALKDLQTLPEPINLDAGFFFLYGGNALVRTLAGLHRTADLNRTQTMLGHAKIQFGRQTTRISLYKAAMALRKGDQSSAQAYCSNAIKSEPGYAGSYYLRAAISLRQAHFVHAIKDLDNAIMMCPDFASAYILRALCKFLSDEKKEAMVDANKAIELAPEPNKYWLRAAMKLAMDDDEGGQADLARAMKSPDVHWMAFSIHGDLMFYRKQFDEAAKDYTHALEQMGPDADLSKAKAYYRRGLCYRASGNATAAKTDFDQAVIYDPTRADQVKKLLAKIEVEPDSTKPSQSKTVVAGSEEVSEQSSSKSFREYLSSHIPALPTFREGENYQSAGKIAAGKTSILAEADTGQVRKKPAWISDDKSGQSNPPGPEKNVNKQPAASESGNNMPGSVSSVGTGKSNTSGKGDSETSAGVDPYLSYLENKINNTLESAVSTNLSVVFEIEADGVPVATVAEPANNILVSYIKQAAPFKVSPDGKPVLLKAEIQKGSRQAKIKYAEASQH